MTSINPLPGLYCLFILGCVTLYGEPASELPAYSCKKASAIPVMDGRLDERCWKSADWVGGFIGRDNEPAAVRTKFAAARDAHNLYFGFICEEPAMEHLVADETERDGQVWTNDCVEIFIDALPEHRFYYHFAVNSAATRYDGIEYGGTWNGEWEAAATRGKEAWYLEVKIPFDTLHSTPSASSIWRFTIGRQRYAGGRQELSCWSKNGISFHTPKRFGYMAFEDFAIRIRMEISRFKKERNALQILLARNPSLHGKLREEGEKSVNEADSLVKESAVKTSCTPEDFSYLYTSISHMRERISELGHRIKTAVLLERNVRGKEL